VTIQDVDEKLAKSFNLPHSRGALISSVAADGPADKAGLKAGDFLVSVGGREVRSVNELRNEVAAVEPGKTVAVEFYRDGRKQSADVKVAAQPKELAGESPEATPQVAKADKFGLKAADLTKDLARQYGYTSPAKPLGEAGKEPAQGVVITEVSPTSDASEQGLKPGQTILQAGGKDIATAEDLEKALSAKEAAAGIRLLVTDPGGGKRFVFIKPGK
jgi:serine protease Do